VVSWRPGEVQSSVQTWTPRQSIAKKIHRNSRSTYPLLGSIHCNHLASRLSRYVISSDSSGLHQKAITGATASRGLADIFKLGSSRQGSPFLRCPACMTSLDSNSHLIGNTANQEMSQQRARDSITKVQWVFSTSLRLVRLYPMATVDVYSWARLCP
jgi:hypothetical protein